MASAHRLPARRDADDRDPATAAPSDFRFLPYESWTQPRFRNFAGGLPLPAVLAGRPCVAFHGSPAGPGRLHVSPEFARASLPVAGNLETLHAGPAESVYRVVPGTGISASAPR